MYIIIILVLLILGLLYLINRKETFYSDSDRFISIPNYKLVGNKRINMFNIKIHNEILDEIENGVTCSSDYDCENGNGRCIAYNNENRCYKVINKEIYEF